jgi:beta-glucosidase
MGGNDLDMPGFGYGGSLGIFYDGELEGLVSNNTVPESRLDDAVTRVLTPFIAHGQLDNPLPSTTINAVGVPGLPIIYRNVQKDSTLELVKKIGEDSAILLKNVDGALPLKAPQSIAIIGEDAGPSPHSDYACGAFGDGCPNDSNNGTFALALGSGYSQPMNLINPLCAIQGRALQDRSLVRSVLNNTAIDDIQTTAAGADVTLVFVDAYAAEGQDRETLLLTGNGNAIVEAAASQCNDTIVIMHIPGSVVIDAWVNHPNITAILAPFLPGEQSGNSLVSVLYGDVSPSGKLPFTIAKNVDDYLPNSIVKDEVVNPKSFFDEGLKIDYRWFDSKNIEPRYEFGFGLSYSTFEYGNIWLDSTYEADKYAIQETHEKYQGQGEGESLYDQILTVYADVKNTGDVVACEVAQLVSVFYIHC